MRLSFARLFRLSRPRFWIYLFGPFLIGLLARADGISPWAGIFRDPTTWVYGLFFLFPANLLVYGINDIFDYETDRRNPKKQGYEDLLVPEAQSEAWKWIAAMNLPFVFGAAFLPPIAAVGLAGFLLLSVFYSAPPIRAKARPFVDMAFNALYAMPALVGFGIAGGTEWHRETFVAAILWCMAMHAYSAIPDIAADQAAGIATTATALGRNRTILLCTGLYLAATLLASHERSIHWLAFVLGAGYLALMGASWRARTPEALHRIYAVFPVFNTLSGAAIVLRILTQMA